MKLRAIDAASIAGKKVLVRVDYNVPLQEGKVADDTRIRESLPTIEFLLRNNATVILCAHLGRPKGTVNPKYSLEPAAKRLAELIQKETFFARDCVGTDARKVTDMLKPGQLCLLENLRFHPEEEKNVESFAKELASLAEVFVQDAFGAVHRAHASTSAVTRFLRGSAGLLLQKEVQALSAVLQNPQRPFIAILGGAKVSDKIAVIQNLLAKTDAIFVGGAMAYTLLKAQGKMVGNSLIEPDKIELAQKLLCPKLHLPEDHRVADKPESGSPVTVTPGPDIPDGKLGVDIGPKSSLKIAELLKGSKTILWNGPMGIFEIAEFSAGTMECARSIALATGLGAFSVVGGGDSVSALKKSGLSGKISHISTGGGASLEFLEGKLLPGIEPLINAN